MKKILLLVAGCLVVATLGSSCNKKAAATPGAAAKKYVEHIMKDDYKSFVKAISFTEPVPAASRMAVERAHATALRTIHHPDITQRGGIREVRLVSEKPYPDNKTCDVVLSNHYNDGMVKTVNMHMTNDQGVWKIRENPYKEIWNATTSDGDTEVIKVRTGHERDFVKDKDHGEKQLIKDISRRNGDVEVVKMLENGHRHREVIKNLDEGNRQIDKLKMDGEKIDVKDINRANEEILKAKDNIDGQHDRSRTVIKK